jgi:hypothetical protein
MRLTIFGGSETCLCPKACNIIVYILLKRDQVLLVYPAFKGKDLLSVVGIDGTVILKWVIEERNVKTEYIFNWFKVVSSGGTLETL